MKGKGIMSILQAGTKLVRTFGQGSSAKHVVSETVGNRTFTEVLDNKGELIAKRVKEISRQNVGDKLVITRKVRGQEPWNFSGYQRDLVYDKQGKFLGMRLMQTPDRVLKVNSDYVGRLKFFGEDDQGKYAMESYYGKLYQGRGTKIAAPYQFINGEPVKTYHNYKGLPIPNSLTENGGSKRPYGEMSLREMVGKNQEAFSKGSGYEHLNYTEPKFDILEYAKNLINKG